MTSYSIFLCYLFGPLFIQNDTGLGHLNSCSAGRNSLNAAAAAAAASITTYRPFPCSRLLAASSTSFSTSTIHQPPHPSTYTPFLHSRHNARIAIPAQQRVLAAPRARLIDKSPALQKVLLAHDAGELAGQHAVHVFHDGEVGGE